MAPKPAQVQFKHEEGLSIISHHLLCLAVEDTSVPAKDQELPDNIPLY